MEGLDWEGKFFMAPALSETISRLPRSIPFAPKSESVEKLTAESNMNNSPGTKLVSKNKLPTTKLAKEAKENYQRVFPCHGTFGAEYKYWFQ